MGLFYNDNTHGPRNPHGALERVDFVFDPRVGFSETVDRMDLLLVILNPRFGCPPSWKLSNDHISGMSYPIHFHELQISFRGITYLDLVPSVRHGTLGSSLTPTRSVRCHDLRLVPRHMNPSQVVLERPSPCLLRTTSPACSSGWCPSYCGFRMSMVRKT